MGAAEPGTIAPAWRAWVTENLSAGQSPVAVVAALVEAGVPAEAAEAHLGEVIAEALARPTAEQAHGWATVLRMQRAARATRAQPARVVERAGLTAERFYEDHYAPNTPVVIRGFADAWPARRWTPQTLAQRAGDAPLDVTTNREADPYYDMRCEAHTEPTTVAEFVARIEALPGASNDFYAVANNRNIDRPELAPLWADVPLDPAWFDPTKTAGHAALWLGPAGTVTPLHHDTCNIFFVQLYGEKRFRLVAPAEVTLLDDARAMYARHDPESDAWAADPRLAAINVQQVELGPGDAVFLPVGWWHHVRALSVSISLALTNFVRPNHFSWYRPAPMRR